MSTTQTRSADELLIDAIREDLAIIPEARHGHRAGEIVTVHCLPTEDSERLAGMTVPARVTVTQAHLDEACR